MIAVQLDKIAISREFFSRPENKGIISYPLCVAQHVRSSTQQQIKLTFSRINILMNFDVLSYQHFNKLKVVKLHMKWTYSLVT